MKRIFLPLILAWLMVAVLAGGGSSNSSADAATPTPTSTPVETPTPTPTSTPTPTPTATPEAEENTKLSLDDLVAVIKGILYQGYGNSDAYVEDDEIIASFWVEGFANTIPPLIESGSLEDIAKWDDMKEGLAPLDASIRELIETAGYEDMSFTLKLLDDTNLEDAFLIIANGEMVYDAFNNSESTGAK